MSVVAVSWLSYEFSRLILQPEHIGSYRVHPGAIDLKHRHNEVDQWFSGMPVYGKIKTAIYPPASYLFLWLYLGWLPFEAATWVWAATTLMSLAILVYLLLINSKSNCRLEYIFIALMPLSMYATGATIGNGQIIVHLLPMLMMGLLLLSGKQNDWQTDILASLVLLISLVKPSVSVPFFWIVLFVPGRHRPVLLILFGYLLATLFSASFQNLNMFALFNNWMKQAVEVSSYTLHQHSHSNLHKWFYVIGIESWSIFGSLILVAALGIWVYFNRNQNIWLLMGVSAIIARFWTYHGWYDDLLILFPMITLFRIFKTSQLYGVHHVLSGALLTSTTVTMIVPGFFLFPFPWNELYTFFQTVIWILVLVFLLSRTKRYG